jgi:hypothetical protein
MADIGLGAGLATLAFWGFISTAVVAGIWDGIRKREAKHETVRRLLESGQNIDADLMEKLVSLTDGKSERPDRIFFLTGLWILPVSVGLVVFGYIMGGYYPQTYAPLMGASALLAILGVGFLVASKIVGRWYVDSDSSMDI